MPSLLRLPGTNNRRRHGRRNRRINPILHFNSNVGGNRQRNVNVRQRAGGNRASKYSNINRLNRSGSLNNINTKGTAVVKLIGVVAELLGKAEAIGQRQAL